MRVEFRRCQATPRGVAETRALVNIAHDVGVPVIFVKEVHRPDDVDFGRELDGGEGIHCIETEH